MNELIELMLEAAIRYLRKTTTGDIYCRDCRIISSAPIREFPHQESCFFGNIFNASRDLAVMLEGGADSEAIRQQTAVVDFYLDSREENPRWN